MESPNHVRTATRTTWAVDAAFVSVAIWHAAFELTVTLPRCVVSHRSYPLPSCPPAKPRAGPPKM